MLRAQLRPGFFVHTVQRLPDQVDFAACAIVQPGEDRQQRGFPRTRLTNQRNGLGAFDNQFNSGKDG
ncbi:hypothetical protein D3C73_1548100 [compost metagenome]